MSALPPAADLQHTPSDDPSTKAASDERAWQRFLGHRRHNARWLGWRLRAMVVAALIGCLALFLLVRMLAAVPALAVELQLDDSGRLRLASGAATPRIVRGLLDAAGQFTALDALLLHRSARWLTTDSERQRHTAQHDALARALSGGSVHMVLDDGQLLPVAARPHGASGLGTMCWLAITFALLLYMVATVVLVVRPEPRNLLYAVMALAQAGNLVFLGAESMSALGMPSGFMHLDHALRSALDLASAAAVVHVTGIHPRHLPGIAPRAALVWLTMAGLSAAVMSQLLPSAWWWTQAAMIGCGLLAVAHLGWAQRLQPHPLATVLWRFCLLTVTTLVLLTVSLAMADALPGSNGEAASIGGAVWLVSIASILLMLPFLSRTQQLMREVSLLAGVSTVATSLDLLFVAVFSLSSFASLTLALFIALGAYAGLRQWLLNQVLARERITAERMFEQLYRVAREVQVHPQGIGDHLTRLLRDVFEPLDVKQVSRRTRHARVIGDGASLLVPVPRLAESAPGAIVLDFAQRGRRMFSADDARLADRVVEQLTRAMAYDEAVERGRSEERVRIAQDLHDDIGARLLTLIYQAPTREMEDYLRHTLKDLKTLTRGLAAADHRLSHAVVDWRADIAQRLSAADCEMGWAFAYDVDVELSVVQWSALTRILRELVSNAIAHAHATRVDIDASLESGTLKLSVTDNGRGRNPEAWSHGLGLGGVRKRVKQLGGDVQWREAGSQGIACYVAISGLGADTP